MQTATPLKPANAPSATNGVAAHRPRPHPFPPGKWLAIVAAVGAVAAIAHVKLSPLAFAIAIPEQTTMAETIASSGIAQGHKEVTVGAQVQGIVTQVLVEERAGKTSAAPLFAPSPITSPDSRQRSRPSPHDRGRAHARGHDGGTLSWGSVARRQPRERGRSAVIGSDDGEFATSMNPAKPGYSSHGTRQKVGRRTQRSQDRANAPSGPGTA